jgi:predicted Fe-Mo cluster-binding NifX family protein
MSDQRSLVVAVPSSGEGGLEAERSGHFGRCDCFTLAEIVDGRLVGTRVLANPPHADGGCQAHVDLLASNGVTALVVAGIGGRPLAGFRAAGIDVYFDKQRTKVRDAVEAVCAGAVRPIQPQWACGG